MIPKVLFSWMEREEGIRRKGAEGGERTRKERKESRDLWEEERQKENYIRKQFLFESLWVSDNQLKTKKQPPD